ncbi:hypothetical protein [Streptomyces sp. TLI_171]|uniref:hypothetical protein n=1 Tax=Streptomyces sp. TLI_171 TaxID=1938859 RepID=UPI000C179789|nr:hypothetical protein [Streptomyces sp. TLI_171]
MEHKVAAGAENGDVELATDHEALAGSVATVMKTVAWTAENVTSIKTPTYSSYGVKHTMEGTTGLYVTYGVFIAAALIVGYPCEYDQPNVPFGMSTRSLNRAKRRRGRVRVPGRRPGTRELLSATRRARAGL